MPQKWLAAGFNTFRQLSELDGDVKEFQSISNDTDDVVLSTWSSLVVQKPNVIASVGHTQWTQKVENNTVLRSVVGDHDGFQAALDDTGRLYLSCPAGSGFTLADTAASPSLAFLAMAGNGRVACIFSQAPNGNLAHVGEFTTLEAFKAWHLEPTDPKNYPVAHHMVPGRPKQLIAGMASFAMLMNNDNLYTWGDPRHRSLGRSTIGSDATSADKPGLVEALAGLKLRKIALGGWMGSALSEDGAAYLWGSGMPGKEAELECLKSKKGELVTLVELDAEDEPDVIDVSIGNGHAVLATADGRVFVVGENAHGQLGLLGSAFQESWTYVPGIRHVTRVMCGSKSTLLLQEL
ncbi:hypothetical protein AMS68_002790 [Peltaster fructicola]|uniref:RCC1/BLIP-II protein n=1 Tax=Peltaster fructicola TaxID=286661 RepID=A0A6H0XRE3_9PEZI|nr:hypothetical protein AMS68_002790 [Peltaster fructicola]